MIWPRRAFCWVALDCFKQKGTYSDVHKLRVDKFDTVQRFAVADERLHRGIRSTVAGANPEARDKKGHKPVHEAAMNGHREAAELLLGKTAPDPNVPEGQWTLDNLMKAAEEANEKAKEEGT
eukprot:scaffold75973_cov27-Prasinocladus_malaysianus.AAC.2